MWSIQIRWGKGRQRRAIFVLVSSAFGTAYAQGHPSCLSSRQVWDSGLSDNVGQSWNRSCPHRILFKRSFLMMTVSPLESPLREHQPKQRTVGAFRYCPRHPSPQNTRWIISVTWTWATPAVFNNDREVRVWRGFSPSFVTNCLPTLFHQKTFLFMCP
jgi:hypothetical protein